MCDTILAPPESSRDRIMLFGKNSDRQRNEAQAVELVPQVEHAADGQLSCTYITIPQARRTCAVLLCRPFWIWGAEMGANEHGVVIGNEGLHARSPAPQENALTGMDLVRLGLERSHTAAEAVEVITTLLSRHGQGGNCGHLTPAYYNNGFMVADAGEAFVIETVGREWLIERVHGVRAISNRYSIGSRTERVSGNLPNLLREAGWSTDAQPDYAAAIADPEREHIGNAGARRERSTSLLQVDDGSLSSTHMMRILRDHGPSDRHDAGWRTQYAVKRTLCMHAGAEDRAGQTVGSMVSEIHADRALHWVTATAAPCVSIFKPVLMNASLPSFGPTPTDRFDPASLWWRHERLHRASLRDLAGLIDVIAEERDAIEAGFRERIRAVAQSRSIVERSRAVEECWREALRAEERWLAAIRADSGGNETPYEQTWSQMSRLAGLDA